MASKPTGATLTAAVKYWQLALGLEDWAYTIQIGRMPDGDYGSATVDVPYKRVHFRFYPKGIQEAQETVDGMVIHEFGHVLAEALAAKALSLCKTDKDREIVGDLEEGLVTEIERLVLRLHKRPNGA